ncbi:MAG: hypothetical protein ACPGPF_08135, partial [Pontibacterium sp.]
MLSKLKEPNHFAVMRHAFALEALNPDFYSQGQCNSQYSLSDVGRAQAVSIADKMRAAGVRFENVYTSQWCVAQDTAKVMNLAPVQVSVWLSS